MVWSDQSQFPFQVFDNNGNLIFVIDDTGMHLVGPNGSFDGLVDPTIGTPFLRFTNTATANRVFMEYLTSGIALFLSDGVNQLGSLIIDAAGNVILVSGTGLTGPRITVGSTAIVIGNSGATQVTIHDSISQWLSVRANGVIQGWTTLVKANGWANVAGFPVISAKVCPDGFVRLSGCATGGTIADGTLLATLPGGAGSGWTPAGGLKDKCIIQQQGGSVSDARIEIQPNGQILLFTIGAGTTFIGVSGCQWRVDHL